MAIKTILAVAVGKPSNDRILGASPNLTGLRPYIRGLIEWLRDRDAPPELDGPAPRRFRIGQEYRIVYRERPIGDLASAFQDALSPQVQADLLFCMSTSVAKAAQTFTQAMAPSMPVVAIVSDPFSERFPDNFCGVSASRDRLARICFRKFKKLSPDMTEVFVLNRRGYLPSDRAIGWMGRKNVTLVEVADTDNDTRMEEIVRNTVGPATRGLLILPADRFFGAAAEIMQWTGSMRTFWSTPDFPGPPSFGGYGFPQLVCGRYMAERVAAIWTNQEASQPPMPDPKWIAIDPDHRDQRPNSPQPIARSGRSSKRSAKTGRAKTSIKTSVKTSRTKAKKKK
jgi:hypothetical protein